MGMAEAHTGAGLHPSLAGCAATSLPPWSRILVVPSIACYGSVQMRPSHCGIALLLLAAACSSTDSFTPAVTGLAASGTNDRTPLSLPLRICDVPKSFSTDVIRGFGPDPVIFDILGSDFMPEVSQATSSNGDHYVTPLVTLEGPATYSDSDASVLDSGRIVFRLEYREMPLVEGLYAFTVRNPDPSDPVTA